MTDFLIYLLIIIHLRQCSEIIKIINFDVLIAVKTLIIIYYSKWNTILVHKHTCGIMVRIDVVIIMFHSLCIPYPLHLIIYRIYFDHIDCSTITCINATPPI